jgi:hypothetical protein
MNDRLHNLNAQEEPSPKTSPQRDTGGEETMERPEEFCRRR